MVETTGDDAKSPEWPSNVQFRMATPRDIPRLYEIEVASYPSDEAASRSSLQYRQHHAAPYFRCAGLGDDDLHHETVLGFVCATRCKVFDHESMSTHDPTGPLLAIHSVVVDAKYRHVGLASMMLKDYVETMKSRNDGVDKIVLIAKSHLLGFYVNCGFSVVRPSDIVHGTEKWYHLEMDIRLHKTRLKGYPFWVVDSFADSKIPGSGNPAAVVIMPSDFDSDNADTMHWMQVVGREFKHSETAFVWVYGNDESKEEDGQEVHYNIRFITCNGTEVDLCGHATLAAASVLLQTLPFKMKNDVAVAFHARKDVLFCRPYVEGTKTWSRHGRELKITMDLPRKKLHDLTTAIDRSAVLSVIRSAFHLPDTSENVIYMGLDEDRGDLLIQLTRESFEALPMENVNFQALWGWDGYSRGVILCCVAGKDPDLKEDGSDDGKRNADFLSRFFGPKAGIDEDPVTGSAHCTLAPFFATKLKKSKVTGRQTSQRGGVVECEVKEDIVAVTGNTIATMSGSMCI